jgi:hypothetical protein
MKLLRDYFLRPYWMELLGLGFLTLSLFVNGQWIVNIGFVWLIAGTIVNGVSQVRQQFREWRNEKAQSKTVAEIRRDSAYNETEHESLSL